MARYRIQGKAPQVAESAYVAAEATLVGEVHLGECASVWAGAAIRADNEPIRIGAESNVQEGAVLHADPGFPLTIGERVTVGHQAMLHGCTVGDGTLIGIQAVLLNGAVIGRNCLVGAGALVTERKVFPDNSLIVGSPAVVKRTLTDADLKALTDSANVYARKARLFRTELERID
jgi:carbonic anhydrase/acetyltransferase-like protein (isoleucine patch superfamily)